MPRLDLRRRPGPPYFLGTECLAPRSSSATTAGWDRTAAGARVRRHEHLSSEGAEGIRGAARPAVVKSRGPHSATQAMRSRIQALPRLCPRRSRDPRVSGLPARASRGGCGRSWSSDRSGWPPSMSALHWIADGLVPVPGRLFRTPPRRGSQCRACTSPGWAPDLPDRPVIIHRLGSLGPSGE